MKSLLFGLGLAALLPFSSIAASGAEVVFHETFNKNAAPSYGFAGAYKEADYKITHVEGGDADGSGAARLTMRAGTEQYGIGWWTPPLRYAAENGVYVTVRVKFDAESRWLAGGSGQNKFIQIGSARSTPESRVIVHIEAPDENSGCTLGWAGNTRRSNWMPRDFGSIKKTWDGSYGGLSAKINVGWDCTAPIALTHAGNEHPLRPGPGAALPEKGWYRLQIFAKPGNKDAEFKVWVNSKDPARPTRHTKGLTLGTTGWDKSIVIGGYWTDPYENDFSMTIGEFAVRTEFDPNF